MSKQKSELNKVLSMFIESLNPEVERQFLDYLKSTTPEDKTIQIVKDSVDFIQRFEKIMLDDVSSEEEKNRLILSSLVNRLLHDLALFHDFTSFIKMYK